MGLSGVSGSFWEACSGGQELKSQNLVKILADCPAHCIYGNVCKVGSVTLPQGGRSNMLQHALKLVSSWSQVGLKLVSSWSVAGLVVHAEPRLTGARSTPPVGDGACEVGRHSGRNSGGTEARDCRHRSMLLASEGASSTAGGAS